MMDEIIIIVAGGIILAIICVIAKHINNDKTHPEKKDIVFKDVCNTKHKGLEDCIEGKIKSLDEKFDTFREDVKNEFSEVKELIRNGH